MGKEMLVDDKQMTTNAHVKIFKSTLPFLKFIIQVAQISFGLNAPVQCNKSIL